MKKHLFFAAAIAAALTLSACGGKSNTPAPAADSTEAVADADSALQALDPETQDAVTAITGAVSQALDNKDPKAVTTALADIAATYKALVNAGKLDEAKNYATALKSFVNKNADALKSLASSGESTAASSITTIVNSIASLPTAAGTTAEEAKAAVTDDVVSLASPYIQKGAAAAATAEAAAEAIKNAPQTVKDAATQAATSAVNNAKEQAETAAKTAVSNAEEKATNAVNAEKEKAQKKASEAVENTQKKANDAVNKAAGKALKGLGL